ncbi:MAG: sigma-54-dependent Fis family transcriptional regulator [Proteobacteria bacterium]|nr:sigma-54-dependent Fis family transcriptional regulator [Pseudomonadota bacterium]
MSTLHLYCELREPSLSRAVHEARRLGRYTLDIVHIRSADLADNLRRISAAMGDDDLGMIFMLYAPGGELKEAADVVAGLSRDLRSRITLSCSLYNTGLRSWAEDLGLNYDDNCYEAPRRAVWKPIAVACAVTLAERNWIQYRLMRVLIAGKNPAQIYREIVETLRRGELTEAQLNRGQRFFERGEPDMAGGNYAEERHVNPNAIDLLRERTVKVGRSGLNTLIIGETGTGKESLAWYLHDFSIRGDKPFLALNCAFFEGERLESELFGHEQGAFTDAKKAKRGLVEEADGGALFLDELPEMAPRVQAKLLRFLQDGSYTRMGGTSVLRADARIISAAQPGRLDTLRPDLYYRVADVELHTVPLRDMKERDIVNIACNLAYRLMWQPVISAAGAAILTPDIIREIWRVVALPENAAALSGYSWPGNMRELSTLIKRFVLLNDNIFEELRQNVRRTTQTPVVQCQVCDSELQHFLLPLSSQEELENRQLKLKELQPAFVRHIVASLGGRENIQSTKLAEALGCSYNTLMGYLK